MPDDRALTEVLDVGQLDKVVRHRNWELEGENGHVTTRNQSKQEELPGDLMTDLAEEIGDGLAKVTVGAELGHSKEYGCKAQAFVSISVHCNNDEDTIQRVQGVLHERARAFVNQDLEEMMADRDRYLQKDRTGEPDGRLARTGGPAKPAKATPKGGVNPKGKIRSRPSFKR